MGYEIVPKRDFGRDSKETGFIVTDGMCNIMPGGCWFKTIGQAQDSIHTLIEVGGDANMFWEIEQPFRYQRLGQVSSHETCEYTSGRFTAFIKNHRVVKLVTRNRDGSVTTQEVGVK